MKHFAISFNGYKLEYDADYGVDKRSGWTFWRDGSCVKELVPFWRLFA